MFNKKVTHITEYQYFVLTKNNTKMHDLKLNFDKFMSITKQCLHMELNGDGNLQYYSNKPKMSDIEIITLSICSESIGIDSENYLISKLNKDYKASFPNLIHQTRFNKRRKRLKSWIEEVNKRLSSQLNEGEDIWMVDSMPVPICKNGREDQLKICRQDFETAPDKGYSAVNKQYFIGYKLHLMISLRGIYHSMDLSKASVHDINFLHDIVHSGLNNSTLLADKGYLNEEKKIDLFETVSIKLETPKRSNQKDYKPYPYLTISQK